MKNILIFFGGKSPEHEVSVITGLQIFEHIDRSIYNPIPVFVTKRGQFFQLKNIKDRRDFSLSKKNRIYFTYDESKRSSFFFSNLFRKKPIYVAINTLHGGLGEGGQMAGFFETLHIPFTSTKTESSVICMNKSLAKNLVKETSIPVIKYVSVFSDTIKSNVKSICEHIQEEIGLPAIIKPVHFGSSIGIKVAKTAIELELGILECSHLDSEIMVEKYLNKMSEYNCSVNTIDNNIVTSAIENPLLKEEILDFASKYEKGGKKVLGGMASLSRELPANISAELSTLVQDYSKKIYSTCRCEGVVRIDFIYSNDDNQLYFNEINPIPGSLAFYLWEATGVSFKKQISTLIEDVVRKQENNFNNTYTQQSNVVETFINNHKN